MSSRIDKQDLVTEGALKAFPELLGQISKVIDEAKKLKSEFKDVNSLLKLSEAIKKQKTNTDKLTASQKELNRQTKALIKEKAKFANINSKVNKQLIETQEKTRAATRAMREQAKAQLGLKKTSGGLSGAFSRMIKSIGIYAAAMFGLTRIVSFFTRDLLNLTKRLDSMDFSMKTIIKDQKELAATNIFLSKTAKNYGLDILTLTERYIKFRAAAQQSNMSALETMKIFDSTAKAASVLGLKTDEVNGVFLALEQMISKGKVTTEELRRQLGERLPGAMGIMADAMGVSISELDKMLKKGEVLSSEALPKFADALEKAYGIESLKKVDNLAAAQGRLSTAWVEFIDELEASQTYIKVLNAGTRFIDAINKRSDFELVGNKAGENIAEIRSEVAKLSTEEERGLFLREKINKLQEDAIFNQSQIEKTEEEINKIRFVWGKKREQQLLESTIAQREIEIKAAARTVAEIREIFNQLVIDKKEGFIPFDSKAFAKKISAAESEFKGLALVQDETLKRQAIDRSAFYEDDQKTYKKFLLNQVKELKKKTDESEELYNKQKDLVSEIYNGGDATPEQKKFYIEQQTLESDRLTDLQNHVEASILLQEKLLDPKKGGGADDSLAIAKANNARILALREEQFRFRESAMTRELQKEVELLKIKKKLNDNLTQFTKEGSKERAQVLAESQKIQTDISQAQAQERLIIDEEYFTNSASDSENWKNEQISDIYEIADEAKVAAAQRLNTEFLNSKRSAKDRINIKWKETVELLSIEAKAVNDILKITTLSADERAQKEEELAKLKELLAQKGVDFGKKSEAQRIKDIRERAQQAQAIATAGFAINQGLNDRALANNKRRFELESQAAGENKFKQLVAERKFEKEQSKIKKKQAIANKAAAVTTIIINTAVAASTTLAETGFLGIPILPLIYGLGALQLAAVLAQPIPAFEEGGSHAGGLAEFSEENKPELFLPSNGGSPFLTPAKHTIANMPAGEFIPHDKTAAMLANNAISNTYDMIDMSQTNNHLRKIDRNTSESVEYVGNEKIVRKRSFVGKYRVK